MKKKNNIALYLVIGCMITLLGALLGIYVGKGLVDCTCDKDCNTNKPSEVVENVKKSKIVDIGWASLAVLDDGNVYVKLRDNYIIFNIYDEETGKIYENTVKNYKSYTLKNLDYSNHYNGTFTGMKLNVKDVDNIYSYAYGHTIKDTTGLLLLNQDKTVSIISVKSLINGKTEVTKIPELKDIKEIYTDTSGQAADTYAVDNNGTEYKIRDYLKTDY